MSGITTGRFLTVAAESRILAAIARIAGTRAGNGGRLTPAMWEVSYLRRRVASRLAPLDAPDAVTIAGDSWLLRTIEQWFQVVIAAWRGSSSRRWLERTFLGSRSAEARVASIGWIAVSASATHVALVGVNSLLAMPGAGLGWLAVLPLAVVCIRKPKAVISALSARSRR